MRTIALLLLLFAGCVSGPAPVGYYETIIRNGSGLQPFCGTP